MKRRALLTYIPQRVWFQLIINYVNILQILQHGWLSKLLSLKNTYRKYIFGQFRNSFQTYNNCTQCLQMCASWQFTQLTPQYSQRLKLQFVHSDWITDDRSQLTQLSLSLFATLPFMKIALPSPSSRTFLNLSCCLHSSDWLLLELFLAPSNNRPTVLSAH